MNDTEKKIKLSQAKYILSIPLPLAACKGVIIDFKQVFFTPNHSKLLLWAWDIHPFNCPSDSWDILKNIGEHIIWIYQSTAVTISTKLNTTQLCTYSHQIYFSNIYTFLSYFTQVLLSKLTWIYKVCTTLATILIVILIPHLKTLFYILLSGDESSSSQWPLRNTYWCNTAYMFFWVIFKHR